MTTHEGLTRLNQIDEKRANIGDFRNPVLVSELTTIRNNIGHSLRMEFNKRDVQCTAVLSQYPERLNPVLDITFAMSHGFKAGDDATVRAFLDMIFDRGMRYKGRRIDVHYHFDKP